MSIRYNHRICLLKTIIGFLTLLFTLTDLNSQVVFKEDATVRNAIGAYKQKYRSKDMIKAWRIQFLYTNERRKLEENLYQIKRQFPQFEIKWNQRGPYYLIRGGAFETELEAIRFLEEIKEDYPDALTVTEEIEPQEILESLQK